MHLTISLNNKYQRKPVWVNIFGVSCPKIAPLDLSEDQFQIYSKISKNYPHSFLFESLTGPEELAETSVMGFDPKTVLRGYVDRVEIIKEGTVASIPTSDPFEELKKILRNGNDQSYRYLGGAVGVVNYDAIRLVEDIPDRHVAPQPIMEFGIYDDGIMYDNLKKKLFYFYYDENRFEEFDISGDSTEEFHAGEITPNMNYDKFSQIVKTAKRYIHDGDIFQTVLSLSLIHISEPTRPY